MRSSRALGWGLVALGAVIATTAVLGPFVTGVIRYRTSSTALNQITGGDAAALLIIAPACLIIGVLALRGHPAAAALALGPALFAAYTYTQLIVGEEYLQLPGNNERYFPLLYSGFLLGAAVAVSAWSRVDPPTLPAPSRRLERTTAIVLFAVAVFLTGQHLPTLVDAWRDRPTHTGYLTSPTAFWLVKLMDLGIVVPAAIATGVALLRGAGWARTPMYALIGGYTLLGASVTGMAVTMVVHHDPDASLAVATGFVALTLAFAALAAALYRPLLRQRGRVAAPPPLTRPPGDPHGQTVAGGRRGLRHT